MSKKPTVSALSSLVDTKSVICADRDDRRTDGAGNYVNLRYESERAKLPSDHPRGWCPIKLRVGRKVRGVFEVRLWNYGPRSWRVSAIDIKAQGFERTGMTEEAARRVYAAIQDQTTIHSLLTRYGFKYE